ncbi:MAG: M14 family zinc carboxypeptidase [Bacteroidia bacterium]|nr:M14 family zinc carboxypeptidase [Bacteroidia bacterium]
MRKILYALLSFVLLIPSVADAQNDYYFAKGETFNKDIPTPQEFFGFEIGKALVRYDKVVEYYKLLAEKSDRALFEVIGHSWENRDYVILTVSTPENIKNIESIRENHLKLVDPKQSVGDYADQKVIVQLGYNVHGGELAGTDASVLAAYYFVASENPETLKQLSEAVVLLEPALNPDGRERAATFYNEFHSFPRVTDPADIEHSYGFAPHRGNHFYADLNRDWFSLIHPESNARIEYYHKWYPNIYLDYHEMGSESNYYFEPSPERSTWNYTIPQETYTKLNVLLAKYFGEALDEVGALYFTRENFDNISPIYGSTYPDFQGGVGTTLEVGSSKGVAVETSVGVREFAFNIRENVRTSIAALKVGVEQKQTFLKHQEDFFKSAITEGAKRAEKYYVFGSETDKGITRIFLNNLLTHRVDVYALAQDIQLNGKNFKKGSAYVVPVSQPQYRVVNAAFEERTEFVDSIFMDITAWGTVHGFGVPYAKAKVASLGDKITEKPIVEPGKIDRKSDYAYVFSYSDYLTPRTLINLLDNNIIVKAAFKPFEVETTEGIKQFSRGSIVIPVQYQTVSSSELYDIIRNAVAETGINVYGIPTGAHVGNGIDLGSDNISRIYKPQVATIVGDGIDWTEVGEIWYLLGNRFNIPLTKINANSVARVNLSRYTSIILADGSYNNLPKSFVDDLRLWVRNGGVLITIKRASQWAIEQGLVEGYASAKDAKGERPSASQNIERFDYATQREKLGPKRIGGAIFKADLDITNPLAFGFESREFYAIKTGNSLLPRPSNNYSVLLQFDKSPLVSGYVSKENQKLVANAPHITFGNNGRGTVVLFNESPTFRGYWLNTGRFLTNALFFGSKVSVGGRYRP